MTEEALFHAALAVPPAERAAYLAEHGPDADMRRRVVELLAAHDRAGPLDSSLTGDFRAAAEAAGAPGMQIGPYRLVQIIGEGGMGAVWLAEQDEPVHRRVALKLIKAGMDSRQVLARFDAERQALALMDHPNIAKVFDAGTTTDGKPFFVMELVDGVPITKYCDEQHLSPEDRLRLFIPVCQAVQHAHQKGIIHRDLKPSNVLIGVYDGQPVPKVIDFGVAKAVRQQLTERSIFTEAGMIVGTFEYMAPEQAELNNFDIDTRADIYSLGVLLYELLAGSPPFTARQLRGAAFDEMLRMIREVEPPKPSTKLSSSENLPSIAANRRAEPKRLTKLMHGDLDWIAMKCLEKDRRRRYETANQLALEVQRYLADEPVQAGPPSAGYRLRKFARRNKGPVVAVSLVTLALVGGIVGTSWGLVREADQRRKAEANEQMAVAAAAAAKTAKEFAEDREAETRAVLDFVHTRILAAARPQGLGGGLGYDVKLRDAIRAALPFVEKSFPDRPLIGARLRLTMGLSFWLLGDAETAADQFRAAHETYTKHRGADDPDTIRSMAGLGSCFEALGRNGEALEIREATLMASRAKYGPDHPETLRDMANLGNTYAALGRHADALKLRDEALKRSKATLGPDHPDTVVSMSNLAASYAAVGRQGEALELREAALRLTRAQAGADNPEILRDMNNLANSYSSLGRHADALRLREETLTLSKKMLGPNHPGTLLCMGNLAESLLAVGRGDQAVTSIDDLLRRAARTTVHPELIPMALDLRLRHFEGVRDAAGCRATAEMWEKLNRTDAGSLYTAAGMRAVIAAVIGQTPGADAAQLAKVDADAAIAWLRKAVAAGYRDIANLMKDPDLAALRGRADYADLLWDLSDALPPAAKRATP